MNFKHIASGIALGAVMLTLVVPGSFAKSTDRDLPNFVQLHNYLAKGGQPTGRGLGQLRARNFGEVVDLRQPGPASSEEQAEVERLGMKYLNIPMGDNPPTDQQVSLFVQSVEAAEPERNMDWIPAVYVHGITGANGTACMVAIWRVTREGWTYKKALSEMKAGGFDMNLTGITKVVKEYADGTKKL
ncbi:MAG TPA: hypothetical protein V6C69_16340 [Trichormus sp.]|jgi:protein tyrosine phosphatase (PTP) superfamily phosphohydrolase (DUF442 family)